MIDASNIEIEVHYKDGHRDFTTDVNSNDELAYVEELLQQNPNITEYIVTKKVII